MRVFLDFEASSLSDHGWPVEVAWVFQDGRSESHLIAPAAHWSDWDPKSEAIHGITRAELESAGTPHGTVAERMVEVLGGHDLFASAPSWDGKWLSALLRAAGLPRHALRLRDTDDALRETAQEALAGIFSRPRLETEVHNLVARSGAARDTAPAHRALPDALEEYRAWLRVRDAARSLIATAG